MGLTKCLFPFAPDSSRAVLKYVVWIYNLSAREVFLLWIYYSVTFEATVSCIYTFWYNLVHR